MTGGTGRNARRSQRPPAAPRDLAPDARGRTTGLRNVAIAGAIMVFLALMYFGIEIILETQDADAETIAELSYSVDEVGLFDSYAATAWIYGVLSPLMRYIVVYLMAVLFMATFMWQLRGVLTLGVASFLLIAPLVLFLTMFTKETVLLLFLLLAYASILNLRSDGRKILAVVFLYSVYAILFRQYYLLIAGIFVYLYLMIKVSPGKRLLLVAASITILFLLPNDVFRSLNEIRDILNQYRIGYADAGSRTAFINYTTNDTAMGFIINYLYAFTRLNIPVIYDPGPKEAFLMVNALVYFALVFIGLRWGNSVTRLLATLFLAHAAVLTIFEPDLGSYLKHMGTALIFLGPALATLDRLIEQRGGRDALADSASPAPQANVGRSAAREPGSGGRRTALLTRGQDSEASRMRPDGTVGKPDLAGGRA